jgi:hypothetical protein
LGSESVESEIEIVITHQLLTVKLVISCSTPSSLSIMSDSTPYPEPPSKQRNDVAIELVSGSVGGAAQVLVGQVGIVRLPPKFALTLSLWTR